MSRVKSRTDLDSDVWLLTAQLGYLEFDIGLAMAAFQAMPHTFLLNFQNLSDLTCNQSKCFDMV